MEVPETLPDMDLDVTEIVATTSDHPLPALATTKLQTKQNERKRQRLESVLSPINVDISDLNNQLLKHNMQDDNRFDILGALADINIELPNQNDTNQKPQNHSVVEPKTKKTWCPPIFVFNVDINALVETLRKSVPESSFKIKNVNRAKSKIYFADPKVHASMMAILKAKNVHSYSFTPKELKQVPLIIRDLYPNTDPGNIKEELDILVPNTVANVTKFKTPRSIKMNTDTGLFLVTLLPGKTFGEVSHIRGLQNQSISWEKPKKKEGDPQCRRCQGYGHISRNCNTPYKCVKCREVHLPGECQRKKSDTSEPFCVNCNKSGHPANYRGCPAYKQYIAAKKKRTTKDIEIKNIAQNNVKKVINSSDTYHGNSFASLFKPNSASTNGNIPKPSLIQDFLKLANLFLDPEELTLEEEIQLFLNNFKNMPKNEAKKEFLRLLTKVRTNYGP